MRSFLSDNCFFSTLDEDVIASSEDFVCSKDSDIEIFFKQEYKQYSYQLLGKSYCFVTKSKPQKIVCAFTVSNSSIKVDNLPNKKRNKLNRKIPHSKQRSQYPAVLIGQLAVFDEFAGMQLGDELLNFIKAWFIDPLNKTGCRYIIVDAVNKDPVKDFYKRNGFDFFFASDEEEVKYLTRQKSKSFFQKIKDCLSNNTNENQLLKKTRLMYFDLILLRS